MTTPADAADAAVVAHGRLEGQKPTLSARCDCGRQIAALFDTSQGALFEARWPAHLGGGRRSGEKGMTIRLLEGRWAEFADPLDGSCPKGCGDWEFDRVRLLESKGGHVPVASVAVALR